MSPAIRPGVRLGELATVSSLLLRMQGHCPGITVALGVTLSSHRGGRSPCYLDASAREECRSYFVSLFQPQLILWLF